MLRPPRWPCARSASQASPHDCGTTFGSIAADATCLTTTTGMLDSSASLTSMSVPVLAADEHDTIRVADGEVADPVVARPDRHVDGRALPDDVLVERVHVLD